MVAAALGAPSRGLSTGALIGVIVAAVAGGSLLTFGLLGLLLWLRRQRSKRSSPKSKLPSPFESDEVSCGMFDCKKLCLPVGSQCSHTQITSCATLAFRDSENTPTSGCRIS